MFKYKYSGFFKAIVVLLFSGYTFGQSARVSGIDKLNYSAVVFNDTLHIFSTSGYYKMTLEHTSFHPYKYQAKEFKDQLKSYFNYIILEDNLYAVHPGGGILYHIENDSVKRIDNSRAHRNQFGSTTFAYNDTLYNMGGYGLWTTKSYLTYFDFSKKEWHKITAHNAAPEYGFSSAKHIIIDDVLYIIGARYAEAVSQRQTKSDKLYRFDLNTKTWLESAPLSEKAKEVLFSKYPINTSLYITNYNGKLYSYSSSDDPYFYIFDLKQNTLSKANGTSKIVLDDAINIIYKGYTLNKSENYSDNTITFFWTPLPELLEVTSTYPITNKDYGGVFIPSGLLLLLVFGLLGKKIYDSKKTVLLLKRRVYYFGRSIPITQSEYFFMNLLHENKVVDNKTLLSYFYDQTITQDMVIKRKNAMVETLSQRISDYFKTNLFVKQPDPKDKRQVVYRLKKGLTLKKT